MTDNEATGLVRIKKIPQGEAPEHIRAAWVGLTVPAYPIAGLITGLEIGAVSVLPEKRKPRFCVIVPQAEALAALQEKDPGAAKWWSDHGYPKKFMPRFCFGEDEVDFISGVKRQVIREVTDEMLGDPNR